MDYDLFHCFARRRVNAARRIDGLPTGHRLGGVHGHTFHFTAMTALTGQGPAGLEQKLALCVAPLDFGFLPDHIDHPTDEHIAGWIQTRLNTGSAVPHVGVRSAPDWNTTLAPGGRLVVCHVFEFDASHWLPGVPDDHQCARLHGHHFSVAINVDASASSADSMALYSRIEAAWRPLQKELENNCLNDIPGLENPTSEIISRWIFSRLKGQLPGLAYINVCETRNAGCKFDGETFSIWKDQRFESAIPNPAASTPNQVTGRGYQLRIVLQSPLEETLGWVYDFGDVRRAFEPYMQQLDHRYLEQFVPGENDGCLELAKWLMNELSAPLPKLQRIELFESPFAGVILSKPGAQPRLAYPMI